MSLWHPSTFIYNAGNNAYEGDLALAHAGVDTDSVLGATSMINFMLNVLDLFRALGGAEPQGLRGWPWPGKSASAWGRMRAKCPLSFREMQAGTRIK